MKYGETPSTGPKMDTVYQPGTRGGPWTDQQVTSTRRRILQMIHPNWAVQKGMNEAKRRGGQGRTGVTENKILRLAFHDCVGYEEGGVCDGCLNWKGVGHRNPNSHLHKKDMYRMDASGVNATDNNGLGPIVEKLELIYTTIDWPFRTASLDVSLRQAGISRADLWALAGLVALERTLERANRACDLDFYGRQQVPYYPT